LVKTADENKKDIRSSIRITRSDTNEMVGPVSSNKSIELGKGVYNIEVLSVPKQTKKDVKIDLGEESVVEFIVNATPVVERPARQDSQTGPVKSTSRFMSQRSL